jgi:hypothetical protein
MRKRTLVVPGLLAIVLAGTPAPASAQGCILLRQTSPLFGSTVPQQQKGTWTLFFTGRSSTADIHYNGTERQRQRETEGTYVVNRQNSMTGTIGYQLTERVALYANVPYIEASWGIPSPRSGGPAARANENANGLGDITSLARVSLFNPSTTFRTWNLQFGGGVKFPTGNNRATDVFPDNNGNNNLERFVDISVHPGDGGWGFILDLQGYKSMGRVTAFGSSTWLANPRDTGTASRGNLATAATPTNVNTVSDQFVFRAGATVVVTDHIAASISWRMEGVPRYDMVGASHGFRRPGVEMYWEPGVTLTSGRHAVSFNFPIGYYYNRFRNPYTGTPGDSTFPEYVSIATYAVRLGRDPAKHPIMTDQKGAPATHTAGDQAQPAVAAPASDSQKQKDKEKDKDREKEKGQATS